MIKRVLAKFAKNELEPLDERVGLVLPLVSMRGSYFFDIFPVLIIL
jgi:hypothetical protein